MTANALPRIGFALFGMWCTQTLAQVNHLPIQTEPPAEVVASPQQWLAHQDWFCPPKQSYDAIKFALDIRKRMNALGANGWEVVGFSQVVVPVVNASCYVATYRAPKKK